jgi:hypothetical protein
VDKACALKTACDAWWQAARPTFTAPAAALSKQLLTKRACVHVRVRRLTPPLMRLPRSEQRARKL